MRRRTITAAVLAALLAGGISGGLTACSSEGGGGATASQTKDAADAAGKATPSASPTPTPSATKRMVLNFGETYAYDSGLTVTVGQPAEYTPSAYASGNDQAHNLKFQVTVVNKSGKTYDPNAFYATTSSGGVSGSTLFDSEPDGVGVQPQTPLLDGQTVTFVYGASVADPADVTMNVSPGFFDQSQGIPYAPVIWTNSQ